MPIRPIRPNSRRTFLRHAGLAAVSGLALSNLPPLMRTLIAEDEDQDVFQQKITWATQRNFSAKPLGTIIAEIGTSFLGAPYLAHPLEAAGDEHLVVNLRAFDCVTFVETTLALSRCIRTQKADFNDFTRELRRIRYRDGVIRGYPSRLHYFTDWINDNERKKIVRDVSEELGGQTVRKVLNIMSSHRSEYPRLNDDSVFSEIRATEAKLSVRPYAVVPRSEVATAGQEMRNGDIIATATSIAGIDVTHTGFAVLSETGPHFLHAPLSGGKVSLSTGTVAQYVGSGPQSLTGIVVARPLEP